MGVPLDMSVRASSDIPLSGSRRWKDALPFSPLTAVKPVDVVSRRVIWTPYGAWPLLKVVDAFGLIVVGSS